MRKAAPRRSKATPAVAMLLLCAALAGMGWIGWQLHEVGDRGTFPVAGVCNVCGRVERVAEREGPAALPLNGDQSESIVMMIAALGGRILAPAMGFNLHIYETAVRLDDGSIRILREATLPPWKVGDRVRVMRGRVEPMARSARLPGAVAG